ncbi:hypothetical protein DPMN_058589 [Dreissena polymorpha]|uniref:Uncharacterized protein n=1 Tax=Dreissena polymorpha TaxID=45954 RepID=A0A9D4C2C3_DREPO|nr:hypothetical protein DPMN_058589 [Dreissena polymorpha]
MGLLQQLFSSKLLTKNVQSVNNYAKVSLEMQAAMSDILSENPGQRQIMQSNHRPTHGSVIPASVRNTSLSSSNRNTSNAAIDDTHDNTNLQGAQLFRCNVTINNYYAPSPPKKRIGRRGVIDMVSA